MTVKRVSPANSRSKDRKLRFSLLDSGLVVGLLFNFSGCPALADSEFSTEGMGGASSVAASPAGYGAADTGSVNQTAYDQADMDLHTGQTVGGDPRAMPKEIKLNNTTDQMGMRLGLKNAAGVPLSGPVLSGLLGTPGGIGPGAGLAQLDKVYGGTLNTKLPKTETGSFVAQSGYNDSIYGDEGVLGPPPYSSFDTIGQGIHSKNLTTGHKSKLPSAWGYPN